jgi:hypothetical protein
MQNRKKDNKVTLSDLSYRCHCEEVILFRRRNMIPPVVVMVNEMRRMMSNVVNEVV